MPNWCENDLAVEGPKEVIEEFLKFAAGAAGENPLDDEGSKFDFNKFIPYPQEFNGWTKSPRPGSRSTRDALTTIGARGRRTASIRAAMTGASRIGARNGPRVTSRLKGR